MKKIAIYRRKDTEEYKYDNNISRVQLIPEDQTGEDLYQKISDFNFTNKDNVVSIENVPENLVEVLEFLIKDRYFDINRHVEVLEEIKEEIKDQISNVDNMLYHSIRDMKKEIEKNKSTHQ